MKCCRYCQRPQPPSKANIDVCHRGPCKLAHRNWCKKNWDQMEEGNKWRQRYEDEFWELNDIQKQKYQHFLSLINTRTIKRKTCLKCRREPPDEGRAICGQCRILNDRLGALASC